MIRSIIDHINSQITGFKAFGLTKLARKEDKVYPVIYAGKGDSEHINFDFSKANLYHRLIGEISITQQDSEVVGCDLETTETYPMKMVAYFPNNFLGLDDNYSALKVAANLKSILPSDLDTIASTLNLNLVEVVLKSVEMDSFVVWGDEFTNVDFAVPSTHNLISIEYDIILTGDTNCFEDYECE